MSGRTLVVGASSPLGRAVAAELTRSGDDVVLASRRGPLRLDVTDGASVDAALSERCDRIVYLANPAGTPDADTAAAHLAGLAHLADGARRAGVRRIVFASSAAVYGTRTRERLSEDALLLGDSAYARLKAESERVLAGACGDGLSVVALRIFNVYGPGFTASIVNRLADPAESPELQDSERFVRDYVHAEDVARAFRAALDVPVHGFLAVNVGTGRGMSTAELGRLAAPGSFRWAPPGEPTFSVADPDLASRVLGFTAVRRVEEMLGNPRPGGPGSH